MKTRPRFHVLAGLRFHTVALRLSPEYLCDKQFGSCKHGDEPHPARNYTMSFVRFPNLLPRKQYSYKVRCGAAAAAWSPTFRFRAPYSSGETRLAVYGDMGNTRFNNMRNLQQDCRAGRIDAIVHMGDHCDSPPSLPLPVPCRHLEK